MQVSVALRRPALVRPLSLRLGARVLSVLTLGVAYGLLLSARGWISFVDESDNFLGGYLIAHGQVLYRDYFSHHMPLPYYLAAIPALFGVTDQAGFRIFASLILLATWTFITVRFRSQIGAAVLCVLVLTIGIGYPWFLGNFFLADTFEGYAILILVLYLYAFPRLEWGLPDQLVITLAIFTAVMSNLMSIYPLAVLAAYYAFRKLPVWRSTAVAGARYETKFLAMVVAPFILCGLALAVFGVFSEFVWDAFTFNQLYYSKYALAADPASIVRLVLRSDLAYVRENLHPLAWQNVDGFALLSNVLVFGLLVRRRRFGFALVLLVVEALARGRGVTFHDQAYYLLSFFSAALIGVVAVRTVVAHVAVVRLRTVAGAGAVAFIVLTGIFYIGVARSFPWRYAQAAAYGYTEVIQATTDPGDRVWLLPLAFSGYLESGRLPATRYAFYLPWLADSPSINDGVLADLDRSQPPLVIIPPHVVIRFLKGDATLPLDLDVYSQPLRQRLASTYEAADDSDERLAGVFLRRDRADELRQRLSRAGLRHAG